MAIPQNTLTAQQWYEKGLSYGRTKIFGEAFKCYLKAAEMGHARAAYVVGEAYRDGLGVAVNLESAIRWYRVAAGSGCAAANGGLGDLYYLEKYGRRNYYEATRHYYNGAQAGDGYCEYSYAHCLQYGQGATQDIFLAVMYYFRAMEKGVGYAADAVKKIENERAPQHKLNRSVSEYEIKEYGQKGKALRDALLNRSVSAFDDMINDRQNVNAYNPYSAALLSAYGKKYKAEYLKTKDASVFRAAANKVESLYGCLYKVMLTHCKR